MCAACNNRSKQKIAARVTAHKHKKTVKKGTEKLPISRSFFEAQQEGFEPPEPCGSSAFEADAISQLDHCCLINKQYEYNCVSALSIITQMKGMREYPI